MNGSPTDYKVLQVQDSSSYDEQRRTHRTKVVHYQLGDGTKSAVELPLDSYTPANVQAAIEEAAAKHAEVMSLKPGYVPQQPMNEPGPFG